MSESDKTSFEGWAILELMGHRKLAGYLSEQAVGGASFLRIDVPAANGNGNVASQLYSPSAVYCITPTTEDLARKVAAGAQPAPVTRWELPAAPVTPIRAIQDDDVDDEIEDDGVDEFEREGA